MIGVLISFVLPLLYIVGFTVSLVFLTKRSFGKCLPITMMGSAFLLFFSQLVLGTFEVGFVVGILFAVASVGLAIWKRSEWEKYRKLIFTSGFIIFLVVYVLVFIYDLARGFSAWDEFSHWGMMLKEMLRLDKFYSVEASNLLVHKDYPPIIQLFELFWTKLCGGYSETLALRALHTFELSLFIPFVAEKVAEKKNVLRSILVGGVSMMAIFLIMVLFDQHGVVQSIYTDYAMAIVVVFMLMVVLVARKVDWFEIMTLMVGGSFLLLLKQMGLPLYLMVICCLVCMLWVRKKEKLKLALRRIGWKKVVLFGVALLIPFLVWWIWGRVVEGEVQQFDLSKISLGDFIKVLMGQGEAWQSYTMKQYMMALGQENISTSFVQISYLQSIILFVGSLLGTWWLFRKSLVKKEVLVLGGVLVLGAVGYAAAMLVLYVLSFSSEEAVALASFNRYMGTYSMIMMITVVMIIIWQGIATGRRGVIYAVTIVISLINAPTAYSKVYPYIHKYDGAAEYQQIINVVEEKVAPTDKIFLVSQDGSLKKTFYLQYYLNPIGLSYGLHTWDTGESVDGKKYYEENVLPMVKKYDYLLILDVNEEFNKKYCGMIGGCVVAKKNLYKIVKNDAGGVEKYQLIDSF